MGIGDFLHVRTSMFRGRADVPGFICRNEYKKIFLTRLVAELIVCSAEGQMFLATYAGMSTKKNLSDTLGGGSVTLDTYNTHYI